MSGIRIELKAGETQKIFKPQDHYGIYDAIMKLTNNDHEESSEAASWAELAAVGESFELSCGGELTVMDVWR